MFRGERNRLPRSTQAEVLVEGYISLADVREVILSTPDVIRAVKRRLLRRRIRAMLHMEPRLPRFRLDRTGRVLPGTAREDEA